ncbi:MAG: TonB-dependent receptor [Candidatus Latescibacteria bacterium]|nr:TonB-dependent receptor [Candidatus Latescibacterota bacterium]
MTRAVMLAALVALGGLARSADAVSRCGRVVDAGTREGLGGAWVKAMPPGARVRQTYTDSSGSFCLEGLPAGAWPVEASRLGYEPYRGQLPATGASALLPLRAQPLLLEGMTVAARRQEETPAAAFVENIPLDEHRSESLPQVLERAAGVQVRHQGGLGSFSTASIRGSTAEQVLVFVDGVPLNQALGGGVDLGRLLVGGVDQVEIYRGAVPARFGGNSLGGVVNLHTRAPAAHPRLALQAMAGSFGTWQTSATLSGPWKGGQYLGLIEGTGSRNNFPFHDDNGTPYNLADDEEATRQNSDFAALRTLDKAERPWGLARLRASHTFDLRHQGIPGIGNYQARQVRFDGWQDLSQVELAGPATANSTYEFSLYHSFSQDTYKDLAGEVGTGVQHHRNSTQGAGMQGVANFLLGSGAVATLTSRVRAERFAPQDLLRPNSQLPTSRRYSALVGGEGELGRGRLRLVAGGQVEGLRDERARTGGLALLEGRDRDRQTALVGGKVGAEWALGEAWAVQAHLGRYQRPPSFYELFGDRGAVIGNTDLRHERGVQIDAGLTFAPGGSGPRRRLEVAGYRKQTRDLIRFVQNSQQISRPYNIGRAVVAGLEIRSEAGLGRVEMTGNYTYQRARNHSPFPFEKGRDLPNAPRHSFNLRSEVRVGRSVLYHELNGEGRQYLDRANRLAVAGRLLHTAGVRRQGGDGFEVTGEVRNLGGTQVEDLWGYPLPGRSFFITFGKKLGDRAPSPRTNQPKE